MSRAGKLSNLAAANASRQREETSRKLRDRLGSFNRLSHRNARKLNPNRVRLSSLSPSRVKSKLPALLSRPRPVAT